MIFNDVVAFRASGFTPTVCIIGSGPAGITLALQLEKKKISSIIIEAGGLEYSSASQDIYRGKVVGDSYYDLDYSRLRYFGGTSGHWLGWCRPLDEVDFEPRKGIKNSGWPIRKKDLDPYAKDTDSIFEIGAIEADKPLNENMNEVHFRFSSPPVRFGQKYHKHIKESSSIALLLNSPVTEIVPVNGRISHIKLDSKDGTSRQISAPYFCLCTGGIENSRLLLWSNHLNAGGVVPDARTLGKYWMEHPIFGVGDAVLSSFTKMRVKNGIRFYAPSASFLRKNDFGNFGLRLAVGEDIVKELIKDGLCIAPKFFTELATKADNQLVCSAALRLAWEQVPMSSNRIELDTEKDAIGVPRVKLYWKKQPQDRHTAETALQLFGSYLAKEGKGRAKVLPWLAQGLDYPENDERGGPHHMGGTRMASTSADGVVDSNCKVFGVDNLYIGGSSIFTTGGHANPTYTIVQLALRLGDHLAQKMAKT